MIYNMNEYEKITEQLKTNFQKTKGRGYCYLYKPIDTSIILYNILISLINKRHDIKILVAIENYSQKEEIIEAFKSNINDEEERKRYLDSIKFLSHSYLSINKVSYFCFISVGINDDAELLVKNANLSKFSLIIFTKNIMNNDFIRKIESAVPYINLNIDVYKLNHIKIYSPVEEYRHKVFLNEEDAELYKKYDNYIRDSISIFGSLQNIEYCRKGDPVRGMSSTDCCYEIARNNGWSPTMDVTIEYNKQTDAIFNPLAIRERVNTIFNITNLRKKLVTDNDSKLEKIKEIVLDNSNKKILIVCVRGEFANKIEKYLKENNIDCLGYHNELEDSYLNDINGNVICYKSGKQKGEPKIFKADALSTNNLKYYIADMCNVLCIKGTSSNSIECRCDVIIFTSSLLDDIFAFKGRFNKINYSNPTITHKIYCADTSEEKQLYKDKVNSYITVHDEEMTKNIEFDEISGDIIL